MAENKRQSVNSKIATPKLNSPAPADIDAALARAIGGRVKIVTDKPSMTLEGTLFTACPITNLVVINTATPASGAITDTAATPANYHVIPVTRIVSFSLTGLVDSSTSARAASSPISALTTPDEKVLQAREREAIKQMKIKDAARGKGVSKEGQEIFDIFLRSLPTRWEGTAMIINDNVRINKPYRSEDCSMTRPDGQKSLVRVRQVLEDARSRIKTKPVNNGVAVPLDNPRKGG